MYGIGDDINDFHVAALLLSGLPDSYETLATALDARQDDELTLEYVTGKLIDESNRKTANSSKPNKTNETALKVYDKGKFKKKSSSQNSTRDQETRECFVCKKIGHLKKDCRIWEARTTQKEKNEISQKAKTAIEEESTADSEVAFIASYNTQSMTGMLTQEPPQAT